MLFESFDLSISYRDMVCDLTVQENYSNVNIRTFDIVQGGITILSMSYIKGRWEVTIANDLHPVVKQDTENFVTQELISTIGMAIRAHYQLFKADIIKG